MAITLGASASAGSSDGNTAVTPSRNVASGATIIACVAWGPENAADATLADNAGNTYTKFGNTLGPNTGGYGNRGMLFKCENCTGNAALVLTATRSGAYPSVAYQAVLGSSPVVEAVANGTVDTATPYTAPSVTPAANGAAILSGFSQNGSGTTTGTCGPSPLAAVEQVTDTNSFYPVHLAAGVQTTAAAIAASWTCTGGPGSGFAWTIAVSESGGSAVAGSVAATLGAATSVAAGALAVAATTAATLGAATCSAAGAAAVSAATAATLGVATCSAAGEQPLPEDTGTVNAALGAASLVAIGSSTIAGSLTASLGAASLDATAVAAISAVLAKTLGAATVVATNSTASGPTIGGHTLRWDFEGSGVDPTSSDPIDTVSGSTLLVPILVANALDVAPTDNYGNTFTRYGSRINYTLWSGYGLSVWRATNINGGSGHVVTVQKDIAPTAEITMEVIEVRNPTSMTGSVSEELAGDPLVTAPVTTAGPSLLISLWSGDHSAGPFTAVAQDGFSPLDDNLDNLSNWIQFACASKVEPDPLTGYSVEWVESPNQGALLALFAFEGEGPAPATGEVDATLGAATASAAAVAPISAAATAALAPATAAATGAALAQGTVAASLAAATLASTATLPVSGATAVTLGVATTAASGAVAVSASSAATLGVAGVTAVAAADVRASTATTLGTATVSASGTTQEVITGTTTAQLDAATVSATGAAVIAAVLARPLAPATVESDAQAPVAGAVTSTLAPVTALANAVIPVEAVVAALLADAVATAFAGRVAVGSVEALLEPALCAASGVVLDASEPPPLVPIVASRPDSFADGPVYRPASAPLAAERP